MTKTRHGKYQIYRFYSKELDSYMTEFFLPDTTLMRKAERILKIANYKEQGFQIAGVLYVDKEAYLSARLADSVETYLYLDKSECETKEKFNKGLMSYEVYLDTMQCLKDSKWTTLKRISMQVRRMIHEDFDVENEIAIQLYDMYMKSVL